MANKSDSEFWAVAAVDSTCGAPTYLAVSTTAATISSLPAGRYWVRLEGPSLVLVRTDGTATIPSTGNAATGASYTLAAGETYSHPAAGNLSVVAHSSGVLWLQPVAKPG